jgi:MFS family permease
MLTNVSLWGNCLLQITTNIGWVFLVRTMPQYLEEVHHVPLILRGWMTSVPIWAGVFGIFFGGRLTDWLGKKMGLKWGRRLPLLVTRFTSALGYGICVALSLLVPAEQAPSWMPWAYVAALSFVAVSVDVGVPSVWAYMQDVGGKHTASILGWGNMWGNLGAAAATEIYARILGKSAGLFEWNLLFTVLGGVFLLGALGAWVMDSSKPIVAVRAESH